MDNKNIHRIIQSISKNVYESNKIFNLTYNKYDIK